MSILSIGDVVYLCPNLVTNFYKHFSGLRLNKDVVKEGAHNAADKASDVASRSMHQMNNAHVGINRIYKYAYIHSCTCKYHVLK